MLMRVLLDPQTFNEQKFGGISRYHTELILALKSMDDVSIDCPIVMSDNLHLKEAGLFRGYRNLLFEMKLLPKFIRKKLLKKTKRKNIKNTIAVLKSGAFDVFVPSYYSTYFLDYLGDKPFVLSVYDMIHEILPEYFTRDMETSKNKEILIEKATKIIAISESTKRDIIRIYPNIDEAKIEVVYLSHSIKADEKTAVSLPDNYVLFVGNRTIYKNFLFFIKSIAPVLKESPGLFVVCAGGNKFNSVELKLIKELGISKQIIQQNFEDNELSAYYSKARCFVFPSAYEGFGIPVLEAMACSCPVILANHSSFPEVAGTAGIYFELDNEKDLRDKIVSILADEGLRLDYVKKGLAQAQNFSWQKTAAGCVEVYKKAFN